MDFKGNMFGLKSYRIQLDGHYKANLDLKISTIPHLEYMKESKALFVVPLPYSLIVPGILELGPVFNIKAKVHYETDIDTGVVVGFDLNMPLKMDISSHDMKKEPIAVTPQDLKPSFHPHFKFPKFNVPTRFTMALHLAAAIEGVVKVFNKDLFELSLKWDSALGLDLTAANKTLCPDEVINKRLFLRHKIGFDIDFLKALAKYTLWTSGRIPIQCPFCDQCPLSNMNFTNNFGNL